MTFQSKIITMLIIAGICIAATGCNKTEDADAGEAKAEKTEHPEGTEHPADAKPKDHPAH